MREILDKFGEIRRIFIFENLENLTKKFGNLLEF